MKSLLEIAQGDGGEQPFSPGSLGDLHTGFGDLGLALGSLGTPTLGQHVLVTNFYVQRC